MDMDEVTCFICDKVFCKPSNLKRHRKDHHEIPCPVCRKGRIFETQPQLQEHLRAHHSWYDRTEDVEFVLVKTMDSELEFAIQSSTTGKHIFDQVVKTIGLRETWCFGLQCTDNKGFTTWLKLNKKILSQDVKKDPTFVFKFRAKFYPEDVAEEIQDVTMRLFYLQVKDGILSEEIYCPPETSVILASYAMQAKYGVYNPEEHVDGFLAADRLLPQLVLDQFKLNSEEWERCIKIYWADHWATTREQAMLEYLKIAQDLGMYGVNYFEIRNKKGTDLYLGVDALGLNIYDKADRLSPKVGFPWSEIRNISFKEKTFYIELSDTEDPIHEFIFYAPRLPSNNPILWLTIGNYELYESRRAPGAVGVIYQMKQEARAERAEILAEYNKARQVWMESYEKFLVLGDQKSLMIIAQSLKLKEYGLRELTAQLQSEKAMSDDKRRRLKDQVDAREREVYTMREEVKRQTEQLNERILTHQKTKDFYTHDVVHRYAQVEIADEEDNGATELTNDADQNVPKHELERVTEKNIELENKLEELARELDSVKHQNAVTDDDVLHTENKKAGRDKYKTLRQIRGGNTKRRIDQYENM
ncbi:hypothetical protein B9Z55_002696 [Caenorhabditis nigoni]|uniref:Moesin/ezrin/radixin homolog 1 n=1 Tax=Caenorhabditis nigoni TaxID=1611254 RepID=A0A2G5VLP5_9PELO|nr:hypothetical protein B9Z55_002696 [Caenorhabditis nigoni]